MPKGQGSYFKGIGASLLFQAIAFLTGIAVWDIGEGSRRAHGVPDRRETIGFMLTIFYGFAHWVLVLPMVWRWKRRGEVRSVRGICAMSILGAIPSCVCLVSGLSKDIAWYWERYQRGRAK